MTNVTLMAQNSLAVTGTSFNIGTKVTTANLQFSPDPSNGYTGTIIIDGSTAPSPGATDWFPMATLNFNVHTTILDFNIYFTNNPWIRARMPSNATQGSIAVYAAY